MECKSILADWLNNAYVMEKGIIKILEAHSKDAEGHPEMQSEIENHIGETRSQAELVKQSIEELGESASETKAEMEMLKSDIIGSVAHMFSDDKLIQNSIEEYHTECMEMATYQTILTAADSCGEEQIAQRIRHIIDQEHEMKEKLEASLPGMVEEYIRKKTKMDEDDDNDAAGINDDEY